ncbi:hypothetical protein GCM10017687_84050 [Streptomyces echinatus]
MPPCCVANRQYASKHPRTTRFLGAVGSHRISTAATANTATICPGQRGREGAQVFIQHAARLAASRPERAKRRIDGTAEEFPQTEVERSGMNSGGHGGSRTPAMDSDTLRGKLVAMRQTWVRFSEAVLV